MSPRYNLFSDRLVLGGRCYPEEGREVMTAVRMAAMLSFVFAAIFSSVCPGQDLPVLERLRVCECGRFLITESGKPFFWLGDTCWHMFGKSVSEDAENQPAVSLYFANRAKKGFTVIQSVLVRTPIGGTPANAYGHLPFEDGDFSRPRLGPGPNDDYWDHVDRVIQEAKRHGLYMAVLPLWLQEIPEGHPMERDPSMAYRYGHFLGNRYRDQTHLIWVMGGDAYTKGRNVDVPWRLALVRALAEGIADGINGSD